MGPYPAVSLKEARERRDAAKKLLVDNIDPSAAKQEAKAVAAISAKNSFQAIALEWLEKHSVRWTAAYKNHILRRMEKYVFPARGERHERHERTEQPKRSCRTPPG
ncbi:MAG: integrase arm-type DNA-binding domain-containing protein [Desulfovibrio sp.]|nr:integrase arm-type DNA-binding domain-containing protein [Desulfovibrio sp.]